MKRAVCRKATCAFLQDQRIVVGALELAAHDQRRAAFMNPLEQAA